MNCTSEDIKQGDVLVARVRELAAAGEIEAAIELCDDAIVRAESGDVLDLADMAICTRGGLLVACGRAEEAVGKLRQILLRTNNSGNSFRAAYHISHYHDLRHERERSLFYARLALDHARSANNGEFISNSHNRIANILLLDSRFDEARTSYRHALSLIPVRSSLEAALIQSNLGYCEAVLGRLPHAFEALFAALRVSRRCADRIWERFPRLGLSYTYLELGRPDRARSHADVALELAELAESPAQIKNALYLMGECDKQLGRHDRALDYFVRLQTEFFPGDPRVVDILISTDIRQLINLMA